jgi:Flp pilus assembly protein TadD
MRSKSAGLVVAIICLAVPLALVGRVADTMRTNTNDVASLLSYNPEDSHPSLPLLYPLDGTIFPPEIVAPTFLWQEGQYQADSWAVLVRSGEWSWGPELIDGVLPRPVIDEACVTRDNVHERSPSLRGWKPEAKLWEELKTASSLQPAEISILGIRSSEPDSIVCRGTVRITTSRYPVEGSIFYRDVPLMPSAGEDGVISPLPADAIPLVKLKLRDISKSTPRVVMENPPTCVNCHSFSSDGRTMGMDMDGPDGDKGAYVLADLQPRLLLTKDDLLSWNSFPGKPDGHHTLGLFSSVSPDGRWVVSTVNEFVYVANYSDFRFLQTFYPTRGILAVYDRETGEMKPLPGADDPDHVHTNAVWTADSKYLVFSRAKAMQKQPGLERPSRANDPKEYRVRYDLYRIPFNGGQGGRPEAIRGASGDGMSNSFPKVSPDGRWIVFVKAANGQLMRPDSRLFIVPFEGGTAREMACNTPSMNSWHSWSPNGKWLVFSSKWLSPFTQMFLTQVDEDGNSSPPVLIPDSTAANRAVNIPEFVNREARQLQSIEAPAMDHVKHTREANRLRQEGRIEEAMAGYQKALGLKADFPPALYNLGVLFLNQNRLAEARASFMRILELDPNHAMAMCNLGSIEFQRGEVARAEELFGQAIRLAPNSPQVHFNLASLAVGKEDFPAAEKRYRKAILLYHELRLEDQDLLAASHDGLGSVLLRRGNTAGAEDEYRKLIELKPDHPAAYYNLGQIHLRSGRLDPALDSFRSAEALTPRDPDVHYQLAETLKKKRDFAAAVNHYDHAMRLAQKPGHATLQLIWLLAACPDDQVRNAARAVDLAEGLKKLAGGTNPTVLDALSLAYAEAGRFDEAIVAASSALALAQGAGEKDLASGIRRRLQSFKSKHPWREREW